MNDYRKRDSWKRRIGTAAGMLLGLVLVVAAVGKVMDPILFAQQIRNEGLTGVLSANTIMLIAIGLEMGLGTALLLGIRTSWVLLPTTFLVSFFLFLTGRNYLLILLGYRDPSYDCGCFGVLFERTGVEAFWQDLFILLVPLAFAYWKRPKTGRHFPPVRTIGVLVATVAILIYAVGVAGLPPDTHGQPAAIAGASFQPAEEYMVIIDGELRSQDRVYQSENLELLIWSEELEQTALLDIRTNQVHLAERDAVVVDREGAQVDRSQFEQTGSFSIGQDGLALEVSGHKLELKNRPANSK